MYKWTRIIIFVLFLGILNLHAKELETFIQENNYREKGSVSIVLENSYHYHDIEDDDNDFEYEYQKNLSSLGLAYFIDNRSVLRGSFSYAYNINNSDKNSFANDPILSYWRRISFAESGSGLYGDIGVELIPLLSQKYSKQFTFGNCAVLKYRFGLKDNKQKVHATYFLGLREGRRLNEDNESLKVSANVFYGIDLVYEFLVSTKFSFGGRFGITKNSEHSGTAYFAASDFSSSWELEYNLFVSYTINKSYKIALNYLTSDEGPSANRFKQTRDLDVEENRILLSFLIDIS